MLRVQNPIAVVVIKFIQLSIDTKFTYIDLRRLFWWLYRPHWVNQNFIYKISIGFKSKLLEKRLQISVELEINLFSLETFWYSILPVWWTKLQQLSLVLFHCCLIVFSFQGAGGGRQRVTFFFYSLSSCHFLVIQHSSLFFFYETSKYCRKWVIIYEFESNFNSSWFKV